MREPARARLPAPGADLVAFWGRARRLPRLGDVPAPWQYRGWLLPYVIGLHGLVPAVADRWGYHLRTLEAGRLPDEPIPQVVFGSPDAKVFRLLRDWSGPVGQDCGGWADFGSLLDWFCWALALGRGEPRLGDGANEHLYRRVDVSPLLQAPYDYLGEYVAVNKGRGWNPTGFYPTPHGLVECVVRTLMDHEGKQGRDPRLMSACDPAVGSGRMLLHAANLSVCLFGQDIDPLAVAMCKVNGALYAPWLSFPPPAAILGRHVNPPPDSLPVPDPPHEGVPVFRADDHGQGLLFPA